MSNKIEINVLGISFSSGNGHNVPYIVILGKPKDEIRIPIIIGAGEAQSIAVALEKVPAPRPLSHDIFAMFVNEFEIDIKEIFIYNYNEGVFLAKIVFTKDGEEREMDCRPSDGIAIALRLNIPIFITEKIYVDAGVNVEEKRGVKQDSGKNIKSKDASIEDMGKEEIIEQLNRAIEEENYELAAILNKRLKVLGEE